MSCPYLEKGKMAYCRAFGDQKLKVESPEFAESCFSGEFSECSFLFLLPSSAYPKNRGQKNFLPGSPRKPFLLS
jgi:hypothetical protein